MHQISVEPIETYGISRLEEATYASLADATFVAENFYATRNFRTVAIMKGRRLVNVFDGEWTRACA
jgi:hypothetical protein